MKLPPKLEKKSTDNLTDYFFHSRNGARTTWKVVCKDTGRIVVIFKYVKINGHCWIWYPKKYRSTDIREIVRIELSYTNHHWYLIGTW